MTLEIAVEKSLELHFRKIIEDEPHYLWGQYLFLVLPPWGYLIRFLLKNHMYVSYLLKWNFVKPRPNSLALAESFFREHQNSNKIFSKQRSNIFEKIE